MKRQDETTIKPEEQQTYISEMTQFTAVELTYADGTSHQAILEVESTYPARIEGFDGQSWWCLRRALKCWRPVIEDWLPDHERQPVIDMGNRALFPMRVQSRLGTSAGNQIAFTIYPDGTSL